MPVVKGVTPEALHVGVGWFEDTASPGQIGNVAVAGHHGTQGIVRELLDPKPGAVVLVETRDAVYEYHLTNTPAQSWVDHTETWVTDPVPGKTGVTPTQALITLITCKNLFRSDERTVAFGVLAKTTPKTHERPPDHGRR
ncbi:MAG TPA: sortase [Propioniciclava tarda]|nr:sortase [Propioniciclava tarda]HQA32093.1 sortase [Propioniciclava tarda]HQD60747.1 sortase [Propioniciclava tarda]